MRARARARGRGRGGIGRPREALLARVALARHVEGVGALGREELKELGERREQVGADGTLVGGHALQRVLVGHGAHTGSAISSRLIPFQAEPFLRSLKPVPVQIRYPSRRTLQPGSSGGKSR